MKYIVVVVLLMKSIYHLTGQTPFFLSYDQPEIEFFSDATEVNKTLYFLETSLKIIDIPYDVEYESKMFIVSEIGQITDQISLKAFGTDYQKILNINDENLYLVGYQKTDSCHSIILISKYNLLSGELENISTFNDCDHRGLKIKLIKGVNGETLLENYYFNSNFVFEKTIFKIDTTYHLEQVFTDLNYLETSSIDFSRKGYIVGWTGFYKFYDEDFNFRKQISSGELTICPHLKLLPFGSNYLIEHTQFNHSNDPDFGVWVRLLDSNLVVKKKTVILPEHIFTGSLDLPYFGGIDIQSENEIWASAFYGYPNPNYGFYSITKLDSNLSIQCQHFIGYDHIYRIYGMRAFESGGAIVFGNRVLAGGTTNQDEDIYAIRVGENCELPTTATDDPEDTLISISAYPNPSINSLTFDVDGFDPSTLRVEIFNETGITVFTKQDLSYEIKVIDLPAGQYFYRILQGEKLLGIGSWAKL